jgi:hypothetical protein
MANAKVRVERRKHKRFLADDGVFVTFGSSDAHMGRVIDINMYGLAFECVGGQDPPTNSNEIEIFVGNSAFRLGKVPCQTIYQLEIDESPSTSINTKRCGVQFGILTDKQISKLSHVIELHGIGEV